MNVTKCIVGCIDMVIQKIYLTLLCILLVVFGATVIVAPDSPVWYPEVRWEWSQSQKKSVKHTWGGLCDTGKKQSPVNITRGKANYTVYEKLVFVNYSAVHQNVTATNNGHTLKFDKFSKHMKVKGGPLNATYIVEEIHFHWKAEHTINDERHLLEMHIVHRNEDKTFEAAKLKPDGIVVIAILFHESWMTSDPMEPIIKMIDKVKKVSKLNIPVEMQESFVLRKLFPDFNGYFHYNGSLTTPPCSEAVMWIVCEETYPITKDQFKKFHELEYKDSKGKTAKLSKNYRELKPLESRNITYANIEKQNMAATATVFAIAGVIVLMMVAVHGCVTAEIF